MQSPLSSRPTLATKFKKSDSRSRICHMAGGRVCWQGRAQFDKQVRFLLLSRPSTDQNFPQINCHFAACFPPSPGVRRQLQLNTCKESSVHFLPALHHPLLPPSAPCSSSWASPWPFACSSSTLWQVSIHHAFSLLLRQAAVELQAMCAAAWLWF